ncbi:MAG: S-methyl-5'-thioadenosine phosphorylase [Candidatus Omnitrophica bacterium]|nr:S-methyl-5'-thioadenosine phosphorylase [Candidatus Omnitrophota bacterium]
MGKTGVIGGSALYSIEGLKVTEKRTVDTPFGPPSDEFVVGELAGSKVVFLPRHGKGHTILPSELNYRANIWAFKSLGVDRIISLSAVGSMKEELRPLDVVLVDQFIDRTNQARPSTFFGGGIVAHIPFAEPICHELKDTILRANKDVGARIHDGGTYLNMEGPAFSTRAESLLYRKWGVDVIGMTNMPEARLAREAGICYATVAMVTDYDCWHEVDSGDSVTVEMVIENLNKNVEVAKKILVNTLSAISVKRGCSCGDTLKNAIVTSREMIPESVKKELAPILEGLV